MTYEEALNELVYDNEKRDWDNCMFDMAQGVYARCKDALEKQIPKLVKINGKYTKDFGIEPCDQVFCPSCGKRIRVKYKGKFCDKCGQRLKWSEEE